MPENASIFEKTYKNYLNQVNELDFSDRTDALGIRTDNRDLIVPFFGKHFRVKSDRIVDESGRPPHFAVSVVLCKYLIHLEPGQIHPDPETQWTSFREFRDAAPLENYFSNSTEKAIARHFAGRAAQLRAAAIKLGGVDRDDGLSYDLTVQVLSLPRIPMYLLYNDADDEFGAECSVLFERRAERYLDMECLAIVGWLFSDYLLQASGNELM